MSKELEALEKLKSTTKFDGGINYSFGDKKEFKIIENALKRLESIDNAKPSEALERTSSEFIDGYPTGNVNVGMTWEEHSAIKQALLKAQEQEKVLDVIFKKQFNLELFRNVLISVGGRFEYKEYERVYTKYGKEKVTEEEFDTLKRYFK